jgi:hypothetical protein
MHHAIDTSFCQLIPLSYAGRAGCLHSYGAHIACRDIAVSQSQAIHPAHFHKRGNMKSPFILPVVVAASTFIKRIVPAAGLALACGLPGLGQAADVATKSDADKKIDTDSIISTINAGERTRPFPIGEKLAYFVNIKDGDHVKSPFRVAFAVTGMGVAPVAAGKIDNTGHHHILIDMPLPVDIKAPIPFDKPDEYAHQHYKHFGGGETETLLDLPPGKHTLRLLFANYQHIPYYVSSKELTIVVDKAK